MIIGIILSFLAGVSIVVARTLNARFAKETSLLTSTFYNFFFGTLTAIVVFFIFGGGEDIHLLWTIHLSPIWYFGGILGVLAVFLLNLTVVKIPSFYMTLLLFVGQIGAGLIFDSLRQGVFSKEQATGALCVLVGMLLSMYFDDKKENETILDTSGKCTMMDSKKEV
ncbi:MAG: bacterial/archaeal transporter family-2 protein [Clostridiales bacterium]|nr:bacterial/archaeal transporter family-2 protein [Clostridiales bacterium]